MRFSLFFVKVRVWIQKITKANKKKKGEFKDVMEELNYKLSVLRGEVTADPDSSEDEKHDGKEIARTDKSESKAQHPAEFYD